MAAARQPDALDHRTDWSRMTQDALSSPAATSARDALLNAITAQVGNAPNAMTLLRLAEAYAWAVAPDQPHGSRDDK